MERVALNDTDVFNNVNFLIHEHKGLCHSCVFFSKPMAFYMPVILQ